MGELAQQCAIQILKNETLRKCDQMTGENGSGKRYGANIAILPFISRKSHLADLISKWLD